MNSESGSDIAAPIAEISFSINKLKAKKTSFDARFDGGLRNELPVDGRNGQGPGGKHRRRHFDIINPSP